MKNVKILGPGCKRCEAAEQTVTGSAKRAGVEVIVETVTDYAGIAGHGIASTPGLMVDGEVVYAGDLPKAEDVARWIAA